MAHNGRTRANLADPGLVELLIAQPRMIERLAPAHADDGHGRCRSCSSGGQTGRYVFPCAIRRAMDEAREKIVSSEATAANRSDRDNRVREPHPSPGAGPKSSGWRMPVDPADRPTRREATR